MINHFHHETYREAEIVGSDDSGPKVLVRQDHANSGRGLSPKSCVTVCFPITDLSHVFPVNAADLAACLLAANAIVQEWDTNPYPF